MNNFEKIMEIMRPGREPEPLWEPCPFELVKPRLKFKGQKILYAISPRGTTEIKLNKTSSCGVSEVSLPRISDDPFYKQFMGKYIWDKHFVTKSAPLRLPLNGGFIFKEVN